MGVPKFYRWISERYPCLSEVVKEYQVPEFDNLYLDMNGIIHVCSHPNDDDPHFRITEEQIFKDIFHYIEVIFRIVRPQKVFFMAVDGVAPRAKMNQQRGRRFRSAKEAEDNIKKALKKGETLPDEKRFDSNCITPGTKFMVRLQQQLEYMVKSKVTTDPAWQGIRIFLSGHETPGEGEHKITEFIRHERMQSSYDPNTRHCLYGLDADLMMLGLCSHEPHFSLLREEVRFTGKKNNKNSRTPKPEETTFHLLHLSLMREYIDHEFQPLKSVLPFKYDLEAIIDDWVLMGFLVGNDFIPHLPHLHIAHNALPMLYKTYMQVLPTLDGYLNEGGIVNLQRFGKYLEILAQFDLEKFEEHYADFKWLESKSGKKKLGKASQGTRTSSKAKAAANELDSFGSLDGGESTDSSSREQIQEMKSIKVVTELSLKQGLIATDSEIESPENPDQHSTFDIEFKLFKRNYYQEKLHFEGTDGEVANIAFEYILAIQWICHYYYNGVQSWSWYYPFHYAPFLSDLRDLSRMKLKYDMAVPFMPYQQLLAVLPAASKECLPEPYWELMCSERSPIIDYYPVDFTCDLNGKQQEWEAVVLIPFINENRLLEAMKPPLTKLKSDERERNKHSGCHLYSFDPNLDYQVKSSLEGTFPNIAHCNAKLDVIPLHSWSTADISQFVKGVLSGCRLSVYYPGFPTLYHLPHRACLKKHGVKVFQMPSKNENMILTISSPDDASDKNESENQPYKKGESLDDVAKKLIGTSVYVNWPHMEEAKIVAISDGSVKYEVTEHTNATGTKGSKHKTLRKTLSNEENRVFRQDSESVAESYISRRGIDVGHIEFIAYAQPLLGRKYVCGLQGQITLEKQWAPTSQAFALQATVKDISVKDPKFQKFKGVDELYPVGSTVFMLGHPYYGCQGKVLQVQSSMTSIEFETPCEPDIDTVIRQRQRLSTAYYSGWELGSRIGISNYLVSRITGTLFVFFPTNRKWQIGLNLRFSKENSGVAGYTRLDDRTWKYSEAVEEVLREYMEKFPKVLPYLQSALKKQENEFSAVKITGKSEEADVIAKLQELSTWLKSLDCYHRDKVNEYSDMLEPKVVTAVVEKVEDCKKNTLLKPVQITIRPHILFLPLAHQGTLIPDTSAQHKLLDRIVNVRDGYTVPLGLRGTIIGIHRQPGQDVLFDVIFDEEFLGGLEFGGRCPKRRGYRMPECVMINLSHGGRINSKDRKPTAVVRPQNKQPSKQSWQSHAPNQFQRDQQRSHTSRDYSSRHNKSNYEMRQQQGEVQRPQSTQQRPPIRTVMQRPNTNTVVQSPKKNSMPKVQTFNQQSSNNMFDTLWNTLKEQNKKVDDDSFQTGANAAANNSRSKTIGTEETAESNSVPNITAPKVEKSKQKTFPNSETTQSQGDDSVTAVLTSLTQAAKSLPNVGAVEQSVETKNTKVLNTPTSRGFNVMESDKLHQTSTSLTTTVTQTKPPSEGNDGVDHLNKLFNSIKVSQPSSFAPRFAFSPTQPIPLNHPPHLSPNKNVSPHSHGSSPALFHPHVPPFIPPNGAFNPAWSGPNFNPPFYHGQEFVPPPQNFTGYPGSFGNRPLTRHPMSMQQPPFPQWSSQPHVPSEWMNQSQIHQDLKMTKNSTEGTQKLCEMLDNENEDASSSSNWSKGEEDDDNLKETNDENVTEEENKITDEIVNKIDNISMKDDGSSSEEDSVKDDEFMERSTSVEDGNTAIIKKQTKVDELILLCQKCNMMPPIYTYFTTGDEQVVSTVQLWNGVRFSSHSQVTRDNAMEEAAGQAIGYLKNEQRDNRPVSTSPPSTLPYYLPVQNLVPQQYYQSHPAYGAPMSYSTVPSQAYFLPSVPYAMVHPPPVVTAISPEYQQQAAMMQQQYRLDAAAQYNPYFQHYSPLVRVQASPSHRAKSASPVYHPAHPASVPKHPWSNQYKVQDNGSNKTRRKGTEYKLLDEPPMYAASQSEGDQSKESTKSSTPNKSGNAVEHAHSNKTATKKNVTTMLQKPKLAISFNKGQTKE